MAEIGRIEKFTADGFGLELFKRNLLRETMARVRKVELFNKAQKLQ